MTHGIYDLIVQVTRDGFNTGRRYPIPISDTRIQYRYSIFAMSICDLCWQSQIKFGFWIGRKCQIKLKNYSESPICYLCLRAYTKTPLSLGTIRLAHWDKTISWQEEQLYLMHTETENQKSRLLFKFVSTEGILENIIQPYQNIDCIVSDAGSIHEYTFN